LSTLLRWRSAWPSLRLPRNWKLAPRAVRMPWHVKVAGEGMERIGQTAVLGELLAGVLIGPAVFGLVRESEVLHAAFVPPYVHPRTAVQQSRFTVHGRKKVSLSKLAPSIVKPYRIYPRRRAKLATDLRMLGVAHATAFPDLKVLLAALAPELVVGHELHSRCQQPSRTERIASRSGAPSEAIGAAA
jgi:hypothetical protein